MLRLFTGTVYTEKIKVFVGTDNSPEAMTIEVLDFQVDELGWEEVEATFSIPEDGEYYIGFYAYSDPDQYHIIIDDITVDILQSYAVNFSAGCNGSLEAYVEDVPINSGDMVYHGAEVVFTATPDEGYRIQKWTVNDEPLADFCSAKRCPFFSLPWQLISQNPSSGVQSSYRHLYIELMDLLYIESQAVR